MCLDEFHVGSVWSWWKLLDYKYLVQEERERDHQLLIQLHDVAPSVQQHTDVGLSVWFKEHTDFKTRIYGFFRPGYLSYELILVCADNMNF